MFMKNDYKCEGVERELYTFHFWFEYRRRSYMMKRFKVCSVKFKQVESVKWDFLYIIL